MLKKCSISLLLVISTMLWFDSDTTHARSTQPPIFNASAPGQSSCTLSGCHEGEVNSGPGSLEILASFDGNEDVYTNGSLLDISLEITDPNAMRHGFQMVAVDINGFSVGDFVTNGADDLAIQEGQGIEYINHLDIAETNSNTFSFQYQAPDEDVGTISFFATGMAADGLGSPEDDFAYSSALDITWTEPSGIDDGLFAGVDIFPNPTTERFITISGIPFQKAQIQIFDLQGKQHYAQAYDSQSSLDLTSLNAGLYIVNIRNSKYQISRKLVLK